VDNPPDDATLRSQLNNLRGIPNALVTTYTYKPLVGMTSQTDPQGKTIYYELRCLLPAQRYKGHQRQYYPKTIDYPTIQIFLPN